MSESRLQTTPEAVATDTEGEPARLRVALIVAADEFTAADAELLAAIEASPDVQLLALVTAPRLRHTEVPAPSAAVSRVQRALDRSVSGERSGPETLEAGVARLTSPPGITRHGGTGALPAQFLALELDIIVALSPTEGLLRYAGAARFGIWWFGATSSADPQRDYLDQLWATIGTGPVGETLWWAAPGNSQVVAIQSASARLRSNVSVARNRAALEPLRRGMLLSALRRLRRSGAGALAGTVEAACGAPTGGGVALAAAVSAAALRKLHRRLRPLRDFQQYTVGVRARRPAADSFADLGGYQWLPMRPGTWVADPFVLTVAGRDVLFMEEMVEANRRARIVCAEIDGLGRVGESEPVLERPHHLSYPYVFTHGGDVFMIPESGDAGRVELYRARSFPTGWELVRVLHEGAAFDTSMYHDGENFWFFTSLIQDDAALGSQLMLFRSGRLDGDWVAHPQNPVCCDVRFARGAGRIIRAGGQLLRPAQDCSISYGGSMSFRAIEVLTESRYRESTRVSLSLLDSLGMVGPHTYDQSSLTEVIDGRVLFAQGEVPAAWRQPPPDVAPGRRR